MRDTLPAAPGRPGSPGAPANLTPPRHSGGRCAPLAMARLRAACSPRSAPDARQRLQPASRLRQRLAAMRAAPREAGSAALPTYSSRSRPVRSMPSATRRAARWRGAGRAVTAGFLRQPRAGGGAGRTCGSRGSSRIGRGRLRVIRSPPLSLRSLWGGTLRRPGLRCSLLRLVAKPRAYFRCCHVGRRD